MCGITGILKIDGKLDVPQALVEKMTHVLAHRGPDASGIHIDKDFALGHRRLKIIDLETGEQPMSSPDRKIWVCFNGEIYNFKEIKEELISKGYRFQTQSDTEVILKSYEAFGIDCVNKFNGMFAFALVDVRQKRAYLVRDRLGIKPLYYTIVNGSVIFASEIKSILLYPGVKREINPNGISSYLSCRYVVGEETLFDNIYSLKPGNMMTVSDSGILFKSYWDIPVIEQKADHGEAFYTDKIRELLTKSVQYRMISDVPIGAYLSGGLDSSLAVAIMAEQSDTPVKTFTIGFEEDGFNEFEYSRMVAERYKTEHREIILSGKNYIDLIPKLISFKDNPLSVPNEVPLYEMSRELKKHITVVLSGEGADEIFGGYGRIFRSPFDYERMELNRNNPDILSGDAGTILLKNLKLKYNKKEFTNVLDHFLFLYDYMGSEDKREYLNYDFYKSLNNDDRLRKFYETHFEQISGLSHYDQYLWIFEKIHLVGLLHRVDMTTMATAVEARVPFVDHNLVEFAFSIPIKYKMRWKSLLHKAMATLHNSDQISEKYDIPKYILRETFKNKLPDKILTRKKVGFPVPLHKWFGKEFNGYTKEILLDERTRNRGILNTLNIEKQLSDSSNFDNQKFGTKIFMLLNFELWCRQYIDETLQ